MKRTWNSRILSGVLSLVIALSVIAVGENRVFAAVDSSTGITYSITADGAEITDFNSPAGFNGILSIPSTLGGTAVTRIGLQSFLNCIDLKSVTIPSGVTSLGDFAFYGCTQLSGMIIPGSVISIGKYAFYNCSGLTGVSIGSGVTSIDELAFYNCSGLTSVIIPDTVTFMGKYVFEKCTGLTSVTIPSRLISVNYWSLVKLRFLKTINISDSLGYLETKQRNTNAILNLSAKDKNLYLDVGLAATGMTASQLAEIRTKANEITAGAVSDYDKAQKIHDWIANNIYYDFDGLNAGNYVYSAYSVYISRKSVCQGYANLTTAMLRSIGIPTATLSGKAIYTESEWWDTITDPNDSNHAWNAVYADGRWFYVDTTWDSMNRYENGTWTDGVIYQFFFDPGADKFALDHRTLSIPYTFGISYQTHVQDIGWQEYVSNGAVSGTSAQSKRLEAIRIKLEGISGGVEYRTHVQDIGWMNWVADDALSGTSGESKRLEAIQIRLTGTAAELYDVYYRVHAQNTGWLDWAKNGASAGTAGYGYRLEAIEIQLVSKGGAAPGATTRSFVDLYAPKPIVDTVSYKTHVQDIGWQEYVSNGEISGTSAQSKRLEAIQIKLENMAGGIEYRTHVQDYGWMNWVADDALSGTSGQSKRLEAIQIRLTGAAAEKYDIYYCVHAQNTGWLDWAKNGESAGTAAFGYRLEAIKVVLVPKGGAAPGATARAFVQG